jgi:hypothetical protein
MSNMEKSPIEKAFDYLNLFNNLAPQIVGLIIKIRTAGGQEQEVDFAAEARDQFKKNQEFIDLIRKEEGSINSEN